MALSDGLRLDGFLDRGHGIRKEWEFGRIVWVGRR
jgi:hypothetical protein